MICSGYIGGGKLNEVILLKRGEDACLQAVVIGDDVPNVWAHSISLFDIKVLRYFTIEHIVKLSRRRLKKELRNGLDLGVHDAGSS